MIAASAMATAAPTATGRELDRATLTRCKAGDPVAFRAFVVRYERPVFALLSRLTGRGPHVEELAQEAFLKAHRALPGFDLDGPARASTWMLTIATRLALDARKRRRIPVEPLESASQASHQITPETESSRAELGRAIARAAAQLSDDHRAVFVLAEFHDLGMAEMAEVLDVPEATVKTRLFRARERLRELLRPLLQEAT